MTQHMVASGAQDIDFPTLLTMNEADLKSIGLAAFGPRRKIFAAIQRSTPLFSLLCPLTLCSLLKEDSEGSRSHESTSCEPSPTKPDAPVLDKTVAELSQSLTKVILHAAWS